MTNKERFEAGEVFKFKNDKTERIYCFRKAEWSKGWIDRANSLSEDFEYHCAIDQVTDNGVSYFTSVMNKLINGKLSFRNIEFINQ